MSGDTFRGGVHCAAGALASMMAGYNAMRYVERREPRNAVNAVIYGALVCFEAWNTYGHWRWGDADITS